MSPDQAAGIRHLHLEAPLPDIEAGPGEDEVVAVFWWRGVPLGRRLFTTGELPVPGSALVALGANEVAKALRLRGAGLDDPEAVLTPPEGPRPRVSVIVCTRDRPEALALCLDSLCRCDPAADEIVVVDNAPDRPATRTVVEARPGVRYVAEPHAGLSRARNAGLAAATGEVLAFTDDDVVVAPNWLAALAAGFAAPEVGCVTGLVLPADLASAAARGFEQIYGGLTGSVLPARFDRSFLEGRVGAPPVWRIGAGANMALRRTAVDAVGGFDPRLGAGASGCSEDSEFWHRLLVAGWACRYDPAAVVFHHHRNSEAELGRQMRAYMRGHVSALFVQFGQTRHPGNLLRAFITLPWQYLGTGLKLAVGGPSLRRRIFPSEIRGLVEGPFALLRQRRPEPDHLPGRPS